MEVTFDTEKWPRHCPSEGRPANLPAGLRAGQLLGGFGLTYDWVYNGLTPQERTRLVDGLHRQGIEPFLRTMKQGNWQMYMTMPHGRLARFSDCDRRPGGRIGLPYVPAVAAAARDDVLQWFYLNNLFTAEESRQRRKYVMELVWYDQILKAVAPEGCLPHGHAFAANTMCANSRTDWNPVTSLCVVYGSLSSASSALGRFPERGTAQRARGPSKLPKDLWT